MISRSSSMQLKTRQRDIATIARDLNVQYVLDGSVRKADTRLRITAQLVDASTNTHIWSDKYNGTLDDVFDIQEKVSRSIAEELKGKLTRLESGELGKRAIADPRAYEYFLRARAEVLQFTADSVQRGLNYIETALEIAGENPTLLAAKGEAYWQQFNMGIVPDPAHLQKVSSIADHIERLEPGSLHAERLRALIALHTHDLLECARRSKRVLTGDGNDTFVGFLYLFTVLYLGHPEESRNIAARLQDVDPLNVMSLMGLPYVHLMDGSFAVACQGLKRAYELEPDNDATNLLYAQALAAAGRVDESVALIERRERERPSDHWTKLGRMFRLGLQGDGDGINATLTPALSGWCGQDPQYCLIVAESYALAGRNDDAFDWLEKVMATGASPYTFVEHNDVFLARVRSDERWAPVIARMKDMAKRVQL